MIGAKVNPSAQGAQTSLLRDKLFLGMEPVVYFKSLWTPGHIVASVILAVGLPLTYLRFAHGLGAVSHLSDTNPWGLWIGIDVMCGVALAAGGFMMGAAVHIFGQRDFKPLVRPAILTGFLGYALVVVGLLFDLGRPWRLPYPMMVSFGTSSVMFEVGWCVALYLLCQLFELLPPISEWLGWERLRRWAGGLMIGATIMAVVLSTLHQSSLGALLLIAPGKLHPLWYSIYMPVFFLISALSGGVGMIIIESWLSHRVFHDRHDQASSHDMNRLLIRLGKAGANILFISFWLKVIGLAHEHQWSLLTSGYGAWWLFELIGFTVIPAFLFAEAARRESITLVRIAAIWTVAGVILNRINVSIIAFNWNVADRYIPQWSEYAITISIVTLGILVFEWIVNRMPILLRPESHVVATNGVVTHE